MNPLVLFLFVFTLKAEQPKIQKLKEAKKGSLSSIQKTPAAFNPKAVTSLKPNLKKNSVSNTSQKSNHTLKETPTIKKIINIPIKKSQIFKGATESRNNQYGNIDGLFNKSDATQESSLSADNKKKELAPIDNIEKESPSQSIQSIEKPLPLSDNKEPPLSHSDNKEGKTLSQPQTEKKIPPSDKNTEKLAQKPPFSIEMEVEGRFTKNSLSKNQKSFYPHIPYMELYFKYNIASNITFFTELESRKNLWGMEPRQAGLLYQSHAFDLKAGLLPFSLGYSYANSNVFTKTLGLYQLFRANPMDIGIHLTIPLYKKHLHFSISRFRGYLKRNFDNCCQTPAFAPLTVSLKGKGSSWNSFITYLKQDLAFQEPLHALGRGFVFKTPMTSESLISLQGEMWGGSETLQSLFAYYFFPKLRINNYECGVLLGGIKNFVPGFQNTGFIYEWILQGSYELFPGIFLIGERWIKKQKKGPLIHNIWALRLKTKWKF